MFNPGRGNAGREAGAVRGFDSPGPNHHTNRAKSAPLLHQVEINGIKLPLLRRGQASARVRLGELVAGRSSPSGFLALTRREGRADNPD